MMIRICLAILFLVQFAVSADAQTPDRKGYIGVSLGPAFILNKKYPSKIGAGLNLNFISFSYRVKKRIGVSLDWVGGGFAFDSKVYDANRIVPVNCEINYGAIVLGPMYALKISAKSSLDIKAKCGRFYAEKRSSSQFQDFGKFSRVSFGYSLSLSYRRQLVSRWCALLSADYNSGKYMEGAGTISDKRLATLSGNAGIGFQF